MKITCGGCEAAAEGHASREEALSTVKMPSTKSRPCPGMAAGLGKAPVTVKPFECWSSGAFETKREYPDDAAGWSPRGRLCSWVGIEDVVVMYLHTRRMGKADGVLVPAGVAWPSPQKQEPSHALEGLAKQVYICRCEGVGIVSFQSYTPSTIVGAGFGQCMYLVADGQEIFCHNNSVSGELGVGTTLNDVFARRFPRGVVETGISTEAFLAVGVACRHDMAQGGFVIEESCFGSRHELFSTRI